MAGRSKRGKQGDDTASRETAAGSGGRADASALAGARARVRARVDEIFRSGATVRGALEECALDATRMLYEGMASEDPRLQMSAARDILYARSRLPEPKPEDDKPKMSPEEERAAVVAALRTPEVRAVLLETGWSPPASEVS